MLDRPQRITFAEMRESGVRRGMLVCLLLVLSACSSDRIDIPPAVYVPPSPPTQDAVIKGLKAAASGRCGYPARCEVNELRTTLRTNARLVSLIFAVLVMAVAPHKQVGDGGSSRISDGAGCTKQAKSKSCYCAPRIWDFEPARAPRIESVNNENPALFMHGSSAVARL
jgi:hypothetical protein